MRHRRLIAAALTLGAALAAPSGAFADEKDVLGELSGASNAVALGSYTVTATDPLGIAGFNFKVEPKVTWSGKFQSIVGWETAKVRQGSYLHVSRNTPIQSGSMKVTWRLTGAIEIIHANLMKFPDFTTSATVNCLPLTYGSTAYTCTATSDPLVVHRTYGVPFSPYVKVVLKARFSITPEGAVVERTWSVPDSTGSSETKSGLWLGLTGSLDVIRIPCSVGKGLPFYYKLHNLNYAPETVVTQQPYMQVGFADASGFAEMPGYEGPLTNNKTTTVPTLKLLGSSTGETWNLGPVLPNQNAPLVDEDMVFYGKAGQPITFSVATWSECAIDTYEWTFSNGTKSFGKTPQRTFNTPGWYDGKVKVTDETGLSTTKTFTFKVS